MKSTFEKKVIAKRNIKKGEKIKFSDLDFKKSNKGIKVAYYEKILGKIIKKNILKNNPIKKEDINFK